MISGLAAGIDASAHEAAGGATIAVLGQGFGAPLPSWQAALKERILTAGGLIVTEFPASQAAALWTFPVRNRVIAALASAIVVIEAASRSGTKITARLALEYGREVAAVPGPPEAPTSQGCLDLIEEGARVVRGPTTVLDLLGATPVRDAPPSSTQADPVLTLLGNGATVDELAERCGLPTATLLARLAALEQQGQVARVAGARYEPRTCALRP